MQDMTFLLRQIPPPAGTMVLWELPKEASEKCICAHLVWQRITNGGVGGLKMQAEYYA